MGVREMNINKKKYIHPEVRKVAVDTSLVLMLLSPRSGKSVSKSPDELEEPSFQSPFVDKPFN